MAIVSTLVNNNSELSIDENGEYSLKISNFNIDNCKVKIFQNSTEEVQSIWKLKSNDDNITVLETNNSIGTFLLSFTSEKNAFNIKIAAKLKKAVRELNLILLDKDNIELDHLFLQGKRMGATNLVKFPQVESKDVEGTAFAMITKEKQHLFISVPLQQKIPSKFVAKCGAEKIDSLCVSFDTLHWDALEFESDPITICSANEPIKTIIEWADENTIVEKDFSKIIEYGWNSWDYYRWTISEEEVLKNARFIANDPILSKYIKRIIIDDGWQYCYGEWEANPLFPNGMEYLAKELKKLGFTPGLWIAPTIVEPHSRIAQSERDMLGLSEGGLPTLCYSCMERKGFVLDPTSPKVQKFLYDLFDRYASMGYEYFKLDFMGSTFNAPQFHDRSVSRADIAEMIVKPIAEAVEGRATILGCNYYYSGGNRYVDAVRVASDIHSRWNSIGMNVAAVAGSFYSNKRWWINDPDFALCRGFDTSEDPDITKIRAAWVGIKPNDLYDPLYDFVLVDINRPQAEVLLSIVIMGSGAINLSDDVTKLNKSGLDLAYRLLSAEAGETGIALDLFESEKPAKWLQKVNENTYRVLLINWEDEEKNVEFDLSQCNLKASQATNFWNDEVIEIKNNSITKSIPPRSCLLVVVK